METYKLAELNRTNPNWFYGIMIIAKKIFIILINLLNFFGELANAGSFLLHKGAYMIPKVVNYVWFGGKDKPDLIKNCIESWKRYLPNYELKEWNEDNFPMNYNKFFIKAYEAKKWAFCSDIARLYALYEEGGIYLDTDVEVFRSLDQFLNEPAFTGFEQPGYPVCATMGAEKGNPIIKEMLDYYKDKEFQVQDDWTKYTTNTVIMSDILGSHGIDRQNNAVQRIDGFTIYPREYFCDKGGYTFHHMAGSWG